METSPIIYIIIVLLANYTATWFIPAPIFGIVAIGTLLFGITFTQRDRTHKLGKEKVYIMIVIAALGSATESIFMDISWRIIIASVLAIILSETSDTEIYQKLLNKSWIIRVCTSNIFSIPIDSITFNFIAFLYVFPLSMLISIIIGEIITKFVVGFIWAIILNTRK